MKILAKFIRGRQKEGDYQEMDLFDTDRNPLVFPTVTPSVVGLYDVTSSGFSFPMSIPRIDSGASLLNSLVTLGTLNLAFAKETAGMLFVTGRYVVTDATISSIYFSTTLTLTSGADAGQSVIALAGGDAADTPVPRMDFVAVPIQAESYTLEFKAGYADVGDVNVDVRFQKAQGGLFLFGPE